MICAALVFAAVTVLPADRLALADQLFNRGDYAAAEREYNALTNETAIARDELLYRRGECHRLQHRLAEARLEFGRLVTEFPLSPLADRARLQRALTGTAAEQTEELRLLDSERVAPATRAAALYHLGSLLGDPALFERSATVDPEGQYALHARFRRAELLAKSSVATDRRKAVALLLDLAFGKNKTFAEPALYLAGVQSYNEKRYGEASSLFRRYLKTYPQGRQTEEVRTMTAWSDYLAGKYADAAALCGDGATDDFAYLRAACAYGVGDAATALKLFTAYLEDHPAGKYRAQAELPLARMGFDVAERAGNFAEMVENAKRAAALSQLAGDALRLAWAYEKLGQTAAAEAGYAELAQRFPGTEEAAEALFRKAMLDAGAGRWSACELALKEALATAKNPRRQAESLYWRGVAACQLGHTAEGAPLLEAALQAGLALDVAREARLLLADIAYRAGEIEAAKSEYAKLVREGACERMSAAKILAVGKLVPDDEAKICAQALIPSASPEWRQAGYLLLGAVAERRQEFCAAVAAYRQAMKETVVTEDLPRAALTLGRLELQQDERAQGERTLKRAVELTARDPVTRAAAYLELAKSAAADQRVQDARAYATVVVSLFSATDSCAPAQALLATLPEAAK